MRVTIYARKSTSHEKAAEEAKSVTRQIDLARAFVNRQDGWIVSEDHMFVGDAVSGSIFDPKEAPRARRVAVRGQVSAPPLRRAGDHEPEPARAPSSVRRRYCP